MKLNCKRIDFTYTPGEEIFAFPEESGLPFLFDVEKELTADPTAMDAVGEMLDEAEKLAEKAKAAIKAALADEDSRYCNPMDGEDASKDLLPLIDGDPQTYVEYGKWFYPADLPLETVRQLADGVPVTKELVIALNPKRNEWEEIKAGLDKIGYPNEL